jgi:hypothetical protein
MMDKFIWNSCTFPHLVICLPCCIFNLWYVIWFVVELRLDVRIHEICLLGRLQVWKRLKSLEVKFVQDRLTSFLETLVSIFSRHASFSVCFSSSTYLSCFHSSSDPWGMFFVRSPALKRARSHNSPRVLILSDDRRSGFFESLINLFLPSPRVCFLKKRYGHVWFTSKLLFLGRRRVSLMQDVPTFQGWGNI